MVHADNKTGTNNSNKNVTGVDDVNRTRSGSFNMPKAKVLRPFNTSEVKVLLLENVNETAVSAFTKQGYQVQFVYPLDMSHVIYPLFICYYPGRNLL